MSVTREMLPVIIISWFIRIFCFWEEHSFFLCTLIWIQCTTLRNISQFCLISPIVSSQHCPWYTFHISRLCFIAWSDQGVLCHLAARSSILRIWFHRHIFTLFHNAIYIKNLKCMCVCVCVCVCVWVCVCVCMDPVKLW